MSEPPQNLFSRMLDNHTRLMKRIPSHPPMAMHHVCSLPTTDTYVLIVNEKEWILLYTQKAVWNWLYTKSKSEFYVRKRPCFGLSKRQRLLGWKLAPIWSDTWLPRELWSEIFALFFEKEQEHYVLFYNMASRCHNRNMLEWMASLAEQAKDPHFCWTILSCLRVDTCPTGGRCFDDLWEEMCLTNI